MWYLDVLLKYECSWYLNSWETQIPLSKSFAEIFSLIFQPLYLCYLFARDNFWTMSPAMKIQEFQELSWTWMFVRAMTPWRINFSTFSDLKSMNWLRKLTCRIKQGEVKICKWISSVIKFGRRIFSLVYQVLISRKGEANSMALGGKNNEQHTTKGTDPDRQCCEDLLSLGRWWWIEAIYHILIKQGNSCKY